MTERAPAAVAEIAYLEAGKGVPVVFLHGIGGAARQFALQIAHFRDRFHAVAWDMPGYGASAPLPEVTMATLARALGDFLRARQLERPVLVGHSIGGMIAQQLLADHPQIARALVLAQTSAAFGGKARPGRRLSSRPAWHRSTQGIRWRNSPPGWSRPCWARRRIWKG